MNRPCLLKLLACFLVAIIAPTISAQDAEVPKDAFSDVFREALFAEEAENDLETAIEGYRKVIDQFSDLRKIGASAVFRLGECYRKQGKTEEAAAQYRWLLTEFPESEVKALAKLSRENLAAMGMEVPAEGAGRITSGDPEMIEIERLKKLFETSPDRAREFPTPLYTAAEGNQLKVAEFLIQQKVDLSRGNGNFAPLTAAAEKGNLQMVELLLKAGADIDGKPYFPPLMIAIQRDREQVVRKLIELGADVNGSSKYGSNPLFAALESRTGVQQGLPEAARLKYVKMLVEAGANPSAANAKKRATPLIEALEHGYRDIVTYLLESGADPNGVSENTSRWPLLWAVGRGDVAMVEQLLEFGADPNLVIEYQFRNNDRAVTAFSVFGDVDDEEIEMELLEMLVKAGGDVLAGEGDVLVRLLKASSSEQVRTRIYDLALHSISSEDLAGRVWTTPGLTLISANNSTQRRRVVPPSLPILPGKIQVKTIEEASDLPERIERFGILSEGLRESEFRTAPPSLAELLMKHIPWKTGINLVQDFSGIRILRRTPDAKDGAFEEILVNLLEKPVNPPLEWGDVVEIPAREVWSFRDGDPIAEFLSESTSIAVTLRIGGRNSKVRLWPGGDTDLTWVSGDALFVSRFTFDQLAEAALWETRFDLDLGSAKIRRSVGEEERVIDVSMEDENMMYFPLLDGDVIEIQTRDPKSPETIAQRKLSLWLARPEDNFLVRLSKKDFGVPDWRDIALTDVLASHYGRPAETILPDPDFTKIRIREISESGEAVTEVNLEGAAEDNNPRLSAGAIIEVPSLPGKAAKDWKGLPDRWKDFLDEHTRVKVVLEPEGFEPREVELKYSFSAPGRRDFGWNASDAGKYYGPFLPVLFQRQLSGDEGIQWEGEGTVIRGNREIKMYTHPGGRLRDGDRVLVKRKL